MDLLTRGAGFGYIGSTITSLIYASFTFIFFALEAAIMASRWRCISTSRAWSATHQRVVIIAAGDARHHADQPAAVWTQPLWIVRCWSALCRDRLSRNPHSLSPTGNFRRARQGGGHSTCCCSAAAMTVVFALVTQIGEQVDFLRFLPRDRRQPQALVGRACSRRPGLDRAGRAQDAGGAFLAFARAAVRRSAAGRRADADVPGGVSLRASQPGWRWR
jgi:hypothetical protein